VHRDVSSRVAAAVTLSCLPVVPAQAQDALSPSRWLDALEDARLVLPLAGLATFLFVVALAAVVSRRRAARARLRAEERCDLLQAQLDEAESLLTAEPHLLYIWRGDQAQPERISGRLPDVQGVPATPEILANFSRWLDMASAQTLAQGLAELKRQGRPFNFVVRTKAGQPLEADGRTAGGLATLRLRLLTGERLEMSKLAQQHRALQNKLRRFTAVVDLAPFPVWLRNHDGRLTWANRAYVAAVEASGVDEVVEQGRELFDQTDRRQTLLALESQSRHERRTHAVIAGKRRALQVVEVALDDGSAGFATDVTELEEVEAELVRHIDAHARTLDRLATAVAIFGPDQRLMFSNSAYAELWDLDPEWLAERPREGEVLDHLREARRLPEQADYRAWKARQLDAYTSVDAREDWWHLPDGRTLRVITEQHPFGGVTHLYENVTERLELESRYNALISVQRETLDNLHEGLALFGSDGRLKLYNPAFAGFWNLDTELLAGEPHIDRVIEACRPLLDDDDVWDPIKYAVTGLSEDRRGLTRRIKRPDGTVFEFASVPLPDGATLLTYVDVTDSSQIEQALRERAEALEAADRAKTDFISNISYELRTPLTSIIGFADGLAMGLAGELNPKQAEYIQDILAASTVLLRIIDALLDLASIDAGAMELKLEPVDVVETMTQAAREVEEQLSERGIALRIHASDGVGSLVADQKRLLQVLDNLLSNAIGFSSPGDTITLGADRDDGDVVLWVADTGRGIDPEYLDQVFNRFESRSAGSGHRGPGLGLSLVKSFVELHGGTVELQSEADRGTTVVCRFPAGGPRAIGQAHEAIGRRAAARVQ